MADTTIRIERTFHHSPEEVWEALTEYKALKNWYSDMPGFELKEGLTFSFCVSHAGFHKQYICHILKIIDKTLLQYAWIDSSTHRDRLVLTWELVPRGQATVLRVRQEGRYSLSPMGRKSNRVNFEETWSYILGNLLYSYLLNK